MTARGALPRPEAVARGERHASSLTARCIELRPDRQRWAEELRVGRWSQGAGSCALTSGGGAGSSVAWPAAPRRRELCLGWQREGAGSCGGGRHQDGGGARRRDGDGGGARRR
nr:unnamed protein product [Digitaria exilis]